MMLASLPLPIVGSQLTPTANLAVGLIVAPIVSVFFGLRIRFLKPFDRSD